MSRRRGGEREGGPNLDWGTTDGVNLQLFASDPPYDAVLSDQLIEHLHPDDILAHCQSALAILRAGGRYVLRTPHAATGPHDLSPIYGYQEPVGMHLHEYTNRELREVLLRAGFSSVAAVMAIPSTIPIVGGVTTSSRLQLQYLVGMEKLVQHLPSRSADRLLKRLRGPLSLRIWIVATR